MILNCIYRNAKLTRNFFVTHFPEAAHGCLLYTSDAADE